MFGWHHKLNGHEFEQVPRNGQRQGSLACYSAWNCKGKDVTEQLNNKNMHLTFQIPMQYCSVQHQALLSPPATSFLLGLFFLLFFRCILDTY